MSNFAMIPFPLATQQGPSVAYFPRTQVGGQQMFDTITVCKVIPLHNTAHKNRYHLTLHVSEGLDKIKKNWNISLGQILDVERHECPKLAPDRFYHII